MRKAFTLIEMMVAIAVFSIMAVFLYKSYTSTLQANKRLASTSRQIHTLQKIKQTIFLDYMLAFDENLTVLHRDPRSDVVFLHTSNSIHARFAPYVAYFVKGGKLYRMESLRKFENYPFEADRTGDVDCFGEVKRFRLYQALKKEHNNIRKLFLVDIVFKNEKKVLYKVLSLRQE